MNLIWVNMIIMLGCVMMGLIDKSSVSFVACLEGLLSAYLISICCLVLSSFISAGGGNTYLYYYCRFMDHDGLVRDEMWAPIMCFERCMN